MKKALLLALTLVAVSPVATEAQNCYESAVVSPTPFMGNNDEIFRLTDGSVWQVKYEYLYAYYPSVLISHSLSAWAYPHGTWAAISTPRCPLALLA